MLGRGIDQIQAHPGAPQIYESWARSAESYIGLAERESGPIPRGVDPSYVWGSMLDVLDEAAPHAIIVNLETAVTDRGRPWPDKGIHYRMHQDNIDVLTVAGVDVASLANNHVLDWSEPGLTQTLGALRGAGIAPVGAGVDSKEAWRPVRVHRDGLGVVILGVGTAGSGIPAAWAADAHHPGVAYLKDLSGRTIDQVAAAIAGVKQPNDVAVLSIHWGGNWGYGVSTARRRFAHRLIDESSVDVIHGHSSHHPVGIEVYREHLILYGCGDLITDYEGIGGHEEFRASLGGLYLPSIQPATGKLVDLTIIPTRMKNFQLVRPSDEDARWLAAALDSAGAPFRTSTAADAFGNLRLSW
jgi:poly-gamma-glutamate synthesis protein (capsule biosynthesis protein)